MSSVNQSFDHAIARIKSGTLSERIFAFILPFATLWLAYALSITIRNVFFHPLAKLPGPPAAKISKVWLNMQTFSFKRCFVIEECFQKYNSPVIRIGPNAVAFQAASALNTLYGKTSVKSPFYQGLRIGGQDYAFTMQRSEAHAERRKVISSTYSIQHINRHEGELGELVAQLGKRILEDGQGGKKSLDLMHFVKLVQFDVIALLAAGQRLDIVKDHPDHDLTKLVDLLILQLGLRGNLPSYMVSAIEALPVPAIKNIVAAQPRFMHWGRGAIADTAREMREAAPGERRETLIGRMIEGRDAGGRPTDEQIVAEISGHMIAGTDTTSISVGYLFWEFTRKPWIMEKVYEEVKDATDDPWTPPTLAQVNKLPYLNMVAKETLRVYPSVPGLLPRIVPPEGCIIGGHFIPGGTEASAQAWSAHRVRSVWGDDADEFRPERWAIETPAMAAHFMPFGVPSTPRLCLGHHLAQFQLRAIVALLVRNFAVRADDATTNEKSMRMQETFALFPEGGKMEFYFTPRKQA